MILCPLQRLEDLTPPPWPTFLPCPLSF